MNSSIRLLADGNSIYAVKNKKMPVNMVLEYRNYASESSEWMLYKLCCSENAIQSLILGEISPKIFLERNNSEIENVSEKVSHVLSDVISDESMFVREAQVAILRYICDNICDVKASYKKAIESLHTETGKELANRIFNDLPGYIFICPASSSGKYHPSYALGCSGLARHMLATYYFVKERLSLELYDLDELDQDAMLIAALFHDGRKRGDTYSSHTLHEHPLLMADAVKNLLIDPLSDEGYLNRLVERLIASHMGQWNTNKYSDVVLPKPDNKYERFFHECDYLASRVAINIDFAKVTL